MSAPVLYSESLLLNLHTKIERSRYQISCLPLWDLFMSRVTRLPVRLFGAFQHLLREC